MADLCGKLEISRSAPLASLAESPSRLKPGGDSRLPEDPAAYQRLLAAALEDAVAAHLKKERKRKQAREQKREDERSRTKLVAFIEKIPCVGKIIAEKYSKSKLVGFVEGRGVSCEDVDTLVNSITLVNALILTIPPSIITSMGYNSGTWDALEDAIADKCNVEGSELLWYNSVYCPMWKCLVSSLICCVFGLVIAIAYYILRPTGKDSDDGEDDDDEDDADGAVGSTSTAATPAAGAASHVDSIPSKTKSKRSEFQTWWKHARFAVLMMCWSVLISACCIAAVLVYYMIWWFINTGKLCELVQKVVDEGEFALLPLQRDSIAFASVVYCFFFWLCCWLLL